MADHNILETPSLSDLGSWGATLNQRGLYNTFQFVLRLAPDIHKKLNSLPSGIVSSADMGFDGAEAYSTYLHETVHWWQHVGSTYGMILSLTYPAEAHANHGHLKKFAGMVGFKKSVRKFALVGNEPSTPDSVQGLANIIINNQYDFDAFRRLTFSKGSREQVVQEEQFESVGHAVVMTYGHITKLLGATADPTFVALIDPSDYDAVLPHLREQQTKGYYYGSPVDVYPIGALEIMEGQARFIQLQFLHFASGGKIDIKDFADWGMFEGVYGAAFELFLELTHRERPPSFNDPLVGLFLLICDMALNPGAIFPMPLKYAEALIGDIDPASRFVGLAVISRLKYPEALTAIKEYSRQEYEMVSARLSAELLYDAPLDIAKQVASWFEKSDEVRELMAEYQTYKFAPTNLPVRVMLSHFIAFMQDKLERPEFFCWNGYWTTGNRISTDLVELFERHSALFVDKEDDDGVFPRLRKDREETDVQTMFEGFYAVNITYGMARQWITTNGPFTYNFTWLTQTATSENMKSYADYHFKLVFGLDPDQADLL